MTDQELSARLETLEIRFMHQETSLDELTRAMLEQEQLIRKQSEIIERLEAHIRTLMVSPLAPQEDEMPPPHY